MTHPDYIAEARNSFIDQFLNRYGPKNIPNRQTSIRHGSFGEVPFTVTETAHSYTVEMEGVKKRFTSGWEAARWVQSWKG